MVTNDTSSGIAPLFLLGTMLVILKLSGVIEWQWVWVTFPFWVVFAFISLFAVALSAAITIHAITKACVWIFAEKAQ